MSEMFGNGNRVSEAENRRVVVARQRRMAIQMSRSGESLESIASRLGVTRGAARKMVTREARDFADQTLIEDRRMVHVEALMELWRNLYGPACAGDLDVVDRFLQVEQRLSRLLALDLADHIGVEDDADEDDAEGEPAAAGSGRFVRD